ncbi:cystathionine gamma-synthase [Gulosibacter molinativorax]|uniref:O-succinylhomoserine (Thiol)-lyase n=1 Tax=Gulosibacter molinativorax TaxID=256821 RepID=A0ABT7C3K1_9MICO|nr:cystathionine gamma-synthase [Gulosibacter molinativorax]MDJ1369836.1 O-succinylhomoserine (thiol)-lyase [Gulosibacter molinativorax]QUY61801.1 Cystathionine gamma-synthase [Gulosibacter molinativorax]
MTEFSSLTRVIRAGIETDTSQGAVVPPLYSSSNYTFAEFGVPREFDYTRSGNPTRALLGDALAELEGGAGATIVATGMGAVTLSLISLLEPGDVVAYPHDCYGGSWRVFEQLGAKGHYVFEAVDFSDTEGAAARLRELHPKLVWLETPSNPLLRITDVEAISAVGHELGAVVVADNTFLPLVQRPFDLGVDVIVHSVTKYLNGHSDVVQGAVIGKTQEHADLFNWWGNVLGLTASPADSHLVLRGLRTLEVRIQRHLENALAVVEAIKDHPAIKHVYFPGLESHPGHEIAVKQQNGFGAMLSLELVGGEDSARRFVEATELFSLAESLGGTESLVAHPATMTHASMTPEAQEAAGITRGLLRFSIGIEPAADIIADLKVSLDAAVLEESLSPALGN